MTSFGYIDVMTSKLFNDWLANKNFKGRVDLWLILAIALIVLLSMVCVIIRLIDQSDKHVDAVKKTKLEYIAIDDWAPTSAEGDVGIKRDLENNPNQTEGKYSQAQLTEHGMRMIGRMSQLKNLNLQDSSFKEEWLKHIERLPLVELNLSSAELTKSGLQHVAKISTLEKIHLQYLKLGEEDITALAPLQRLEEMNLKGAHITLGALKALRQFSKLKRLDLSYTNLTDAGCEILGQIPTLLVLNANNDHITATGFSKLTNLFYLCAEHCDLNDADLDAISGLPKLYSLDIGRTNVTGKELMLLAKTNLRYVNIVECPKITEADVNKFKRLMPRCHVSGLKEHNKSEDQD